jgi:hypothetical protein
MLEAVTKAIKDNIKPIAATVGLGMIAPAIGKYFLDKGLHEVVANKDFKLDNIEPVIAAAKKSAGLQDIPHRIINNFDNAFFVPPGSLSPDVITSLRAKARTAMASPNSKIRGTGEFLKTVTDYSSTPRGGIVIGEKLTNPHVVAHELGHAKIEHDGGIDSYIQKYAPSLQTVGALTALASLVPAVTGDHSVWQGMFGGGMGLIGAGALGKIYSEYRASSEGRKMTDKMTMSDNTRNLGDKALNYAFGTYLNNAVRGVAPAAFLF